jgi:hypothetical protein
MEFIKANYLNTTTQISVNSNSGIASNLFNRDSIYQYYSENFNSDATTSSIEIDFGSTVSVSRIGLLDINLKEFNIFYNGLTANSISLVNADTATCNYSTNQDRNKYFSFNTIQASSITIEAKKTFIADQEKVIGLLTISDLQVEFTKIPSANSYKPRIVPKQIVHKMSDGGTRIQTVKRKWEAKINLDYISEQERENLYSLYSAGNEFNFVAFGTSTGWNGLMFETVWDGPFDFYEYSDNASSAGFSGSISLKETTT